MILDTFVLCFRGGFDWFGFDWWVGVVGCTVVGISFGRGGRIVCGVEDLCWCVVC